MPTDHDREDIVIDDGRRAVALGPVGCLVLVFALLAAAMAAMLWAQNARAATFRHHAIQQRLELPVVVRPAPVLYPERPPMNPPAAAVVACKRPLAKAAAIVRHHRKRCCK